MKWMGGWTYQQFCSTPPEIISEIYDMINEEIERLENR